MDEALEKATARKRLWIVSELYRPEMTSTGYYLTAIAEGLAEDFEVRVLCGQPNYSARGIKAPKREFLNGVDIYRCAGTTLDKNVIPFRIINMLSLSASTFLKALFNFKKGDMVLVVTTPPSMPFIIAFASLIKGAGYTLLIHDNYPEILIAVGKSQEGSFLANSADYLNRWLYKYTAKIIACGRDMKMLLERKTEGLDIPIVFIPNWAELEQVSPKPRENNELLKELGLLDKFIFLYAGNMGHPNDMESIISCANKLREHSDIHFIFLGAGAKRKWLENEVSSKGLKNITILDPRPREEQIVFLNACDVAIVSLVKKMKGVSVPSRTYNILAAGKPILAMVEGGSEVEMVVEEEKAGYSIAPNDPDGLLKLILKIYDQREKLPEIGGRARKAALNKYSLESAVAAYRKEF
jgi:colanic acid biosynthesis glycosyl transferase WcaI